MRNLKSKRGTQLFTLLSFFAFLTMVASPPGVAFAQRVLKLGEVMNVGHHTHLSAVKFAEIVKEKTKGKFEIKTYPSAQLGNERELIEAMQMGSVEMSLVAGNVTQNFAPLAGLTSLPYVIRDFDHGDKVHEGPIGQKIKDNILQKTGIRVLFFITFGIRNVLTVDKPVLKLEDLKGLKIRVPTSPAFVESFKLLGANPTPIPAAELYTSLQTRIVDAVEGTPDVLQDFKLFEIGKHYTLTGHIYTDGFVLIRDKIWQELPADTRKILEEASREADLYQRKLLRSAQEEGFNLAKKQGVKIYNMDKAPVIEAVKPYYVKSADQFGGMDVIQAVINTR